MIKTRWQQVALVLIGAAGGIGYGLLDWFILDRLEPDDPMLLHLLEEFIDLVLPVFLGAVLGWCVHLVRAQKRFNRQLSLENLQLQRHVWTNTLIAQVLHDIRNPLHNLAAVMEDALPHLAERERSAVARNLGRLEQATAQYSRWTAALDSIDPSQPCRLETEVDRFIRQKAQPRIQELRASLRLSIPPGEIALHPMLLESVLISLFSNAFDALAQQRGERLLAFEAAAHGERPGYLRLTLANSGEFPENALGSQGNAPLQSAQGLGVGLLLVRKMLESAGGSLELRNAGGRAVADCSVPGRLE